MRAKPSGINFAEENLPVRIVSMGWPNMGKIRSPHLCGAFPGFTVQKFISLNKSIEFCDLLNYPLPVAAEVMIFVVSRDEQLAEDR